MKRIENIFKERAAELDAWADVYSYVVNRIDGCMEYKHDENGEVVNDEDGDPVRIAPEPDNYYYDTYKGLLKVKEKLEALKI